MEKKPFKELRGNRVMLAIPQLPDGKIQLTTEAKKALHEEHLRKLRRLTVYAVSSDVISSLKEGDEVMVDMNILLSREHIELMADLTVVIVSPLDIALVW